MSSSPEQNNHFNIWSKVHFVRRGDGITKDMYIQHFKKLFVFSLIMLEEYCIICVKALNLVSVKANYNGQTNVGMLRHLESSSQAERQAVNTTVQGSAADLVKAAMIDIDRRLQETFPSCAKPHTHYTAATSPGKYKEYKVPVHELGFWLAHQIVT